MNQRQIEALRAIMREASYLPLHSPERHAIEDAASALLRGSQMARER